VQPGFLSHGFGPQHHFAKCGRPGEIASPRLGVGLHVQQPLPLGLIALRPQRSDDEIGLPSVAVHLRREGSQQYREDRRFAVPRQGFRCRQRCVGDREADFVARQAAGACAPAVPRQNQFGKPRQLVAPVLAASPARIAGRDALFESRVLADPRSRARKRIAGTGEEGRVCVSQLLEQHPQRPAVGENVMLRDQQRVPAIGQPQ
jgi:hypothetical protein